MSSVMYLVWSYGWKFGIFAAVTRKCHCGHWSKYKLTETLSIFPKIKLFFIFKIFVSYNFFLGSELKDFLIGQGERCKRCYNEN